MDKEKLIEIIIDCMDQSTCVFYNDVNKEKFETLLNEKLPEQLSIAAVLRCAWKNRLPIGKPTKRINNK